jgi:hypothetical protein
MAYFLARITIIDGEHEHNSHLITQAKNEEQADRQFQAAMHDTDCWNSDHDKGNVDHPFSYGDGCTASKVSSTRRISKKEAQTLKRLICVYEISPNIEAATAENHRDDDEDEEEGVA